MANRIRKSMKDEGRLLGGIVEMGETYVPGNPHKENKKDDAHNKPKINQVTKRSRH